MPSTRLLALGIALAAAYPVGAAPSRLRVEAIPVPGDGLGIAVTVTNAGDAVVRGVGPEVTFQRRTVAGDPADLAPGERREWRLPLAAPSAPGAFPAIVQLRPPGVAAARVVVLAGTTSAPPGLVDATVAVGDATRVARARLELTNGGRDPVAGRVVVVLPDGFHTEPESQPVAVAAGGRTVVPFAVENRAAVSAPDLTLTVLFEYLHDGVHQVVAARAPLAGSGHAGGEGRVPLAIAGVVMLLAFALLGVAWRSAARRAARGWPPR